MIISIQADHARWVDVDAPCVPSVGEVVQVTVKGVPVWRQVIEREWRVEEKYDDTTGRTDEVLAVSLKTVPAKY